MRIFRSLPSDAYRAPSVLTIGKLDGLHRGHQALLARVRAVARESGAQATVMTFDPHPRDFFVRRELTGTAAANATVTRVANRRDTIEALAGAEVDRVIYQHFDARFANLSADAFIREILVARLNVKWLLVGSDFRFGARRVGDLATLVREGRRQGFQVETIPPVLCGDARISSSSVRTALAQADFAKVQILLGRPYAVSGRLGSAMRHDAIDGAAVLPFGGLAHSPVPDGIYAVRIEGVDSLPVAAVLHVRHDSSSEFSPAGTLHVHIVLPGGPRGLSGHGVVKIEFVAVMHSSAQWVKLPGRGDLLPAADVSLHYSG